MGDNTLTIIELILPKFLEKVHDFAMLSLFVDNNTKQWLNKKSRHLGTIKLNLKAYHGKPTNTNPIQNQKLKQVTSIFMQCNFFFQMQCKSKKKAQKMKMTSYPPWLSSVCSIYKSQSRIYSCFVLLPNFLGHVIHF